MKKRIITVSREFGSGGHTLGKLIAEKLGISFYDGELIDKAVEETGFSHDFVREAGEYASTANSLLFSLSMSASSGTMGMPSNYDKIYIAQNNIIRELANKEPCVIVGRCADYVLRDRDDCLNIFVHASNEKRAERILERYGEYEGKSIEKRLREKDKKRALYYRHYTGQSWGSLKNYDLTFDSGVISLEEMADFVCNMIK